jgi:hypothetical protein
MDFGLGWWPGVTGVWPDTGDTFLVVLPRFFFNTHLSCHSKTLHATGAIAITASASLAGALIQNGSRAPQKQGKKNSLR